MIVAAILLIWLGAHQEAVRTELLRLVERTPATPEGRDWPAVVALEYAAHVMRVPRVLLIWSDTEEPWTYLAVWDNGVSKVRQLPPNTYLPWIAEPLHRASVLITDAARSDILVHQGEGRFDQWSRGNLPICPTLIADFSMVSAVSAHFHVGIRGPPLPVGFAGTNARRRGHRGDHCGPLKALFAQAILVRKLSDAAAAEERIKIGRDLHDGVLQSLAGTALQLQALRSSEIRTPAALDERLAAIQAMLAGEQRDLRALSGRLNRA